MNTTIASIIEMAGTLAFAISGIRLAAAKQFDLFGAYVIGFVTAIGGGTIRDVMLGLTPFWMEQPIYIIITALSIPLVILLGRRLLHFNNTFFIFDTIGLALFTIVGLTKTLNAGLPIWTAIIMGVVTGSFGGVMRDLLLSNEPLLFKRDIYALASILGGVIFATLSFFDVSEPIVTLSSIISIIIMRIVAVKFHLHLPKLIDIKEQNSTRIKIHKQNEE